MEYTLTHICNPTIFLKVSSLTKVFWKVGVSVKNYSLSGLKILLGPIRGKKIENVPKTHLKLMIDILRYLKVPKLWELWVYSLLRVMQDFYHHP